jgi:hypothetical protein
MEQKEQHSLIIEGLKRITATAIDSVDSFSQSQIVLSCAEGKIVVSGSGMKITGFSKSTGEFSASGSISGVKYAQKSLNIKQKLFK